VKCTIPASCSADLTAVRSALHKCHSIKESLQSCSRRFLNILKPLQNNDNSIRFQRLKQHVWNLFSFYAGTQALTSPLDETSQLGKAVAAHGSLSFRVARSRGSIKPSKISPLVLHEIASGHLLEPLANKGTPGYRSIFEMKLAPMLCSYLWSFKI
jgi:hypothetical protein